MLFGWVFNGWTRSYFALASRSARTVDVVSRRTMRLLMRLRSSEAPLRLGVTEGGRGDGGRCPVIGASRGGELATGREGTVVPNGDRGV